MARNNKSMPEGPRTKEIPTPEQRVKEVEGLHSIPEFRPKEETIEPMKEGIDGQIIKSI